MRHGSLDIAKIGIDPDLYSVTFATPEAPGSEPVARTFKRLEEVDEFLHQAGVSQDRIIRVLGLARQGEPASIAGLVMEDRELVELGLRRS